MNDKLFDFWRSFYSLYSRDTAVKESTERIQRLSTDTLTIMVK